MGLHLGLGLTGQRVNASPARLFGVTGSRGFMYDLSDYSTQFQDTAATVPITGTAQSVGLVLDQSQGLALGAELFGGSYTTSVAGGTATATESPAGTLNITGDGVNQARGDFSFTSVVGRTYRLSVNVAGTTAAIVVGTTQGGNNIIAGNALAVGVNSLVFVATTTTTWVRYFKSGATLSSLSGTTVRELAGNHATQATLGNRPLTTTIDQGLRGIQFDGVDDFYTTAAIDFSNSDEVTVVAGVRKLSDAGRGMLVELGVGGANGSFALEAPSGALPTYQLTQRGTISVFANASGFAAPISNVLSAQGKISTDTALLRANGTQVATSAADQGAGNFSNAIVYIGRRGGTSLPFNGVLTFLFAINRLLTANELASVEAYANARTGAF